MNVVNMMNGVNIIMNADSRAKQDSEAIHFGGTFCTILKQTMHMQNPISE